MNILHSFISIINWKTILVSFISIGATYICLELHFEVNFPFTLVSTAVVFPLVFSINSAYNRRETALNHYGSIKAHARAIFFACEDWIEKTDPKKSLEIRNILNDLFLTLNQYFHTTDDKRSKEEEHVFECFKNLSVAIKGLRSQGLNASEISRVNQYLSKILVSFEQMKHIYQYRTPKTLRAYSKVFIMILPILYGPYFAYITEKKDLWEVLILPILFSVILVGLDNIQEHLENPFDGIGEDDIYINAEKFIKSLDKKE